MGKTQIQDEVHYNNEISVQKLYAYYQLEIITQGSHYSFTFTDNMLKELNKLITTILEKDKVV